MERPFSDVYEPASIASAVDHGGYALRKELAERIARELLACSGKLDRSVAVLEDAVDSETLQSCRRLVGQIMGRLYIEILRDLFKQYPDLEPESFK